MLVKNGASLTFTYSVNWYPTNVPFNRRFERYLDYSFFEHKVERYGERAGGKAAWITVRKCLLQCDTGSVDRGCCR